MADTLLILAPNRKDYNNWCRNYGIYFKGVHLVWCDEPEDWKGIAAKGTYWTRLEGSTVKDPPRKYTYAKREKIEEAVKKHLKKKNVQKITY